MTEKPAAPEKKGDMKQYIVTFIALLLAALGVWDAYTESRYIGGDKPISLEAFLGGIFAVWGVVFLTPFFKGRDNKQSANQTDQGNSYSDKEISDRFIGSVALLGNNSPSARMGAILSLYQLAMDSDKYCGRVAQALCSHIRTTTQEGEYKSQHRYTPSDEIQNVINLLFKDKGLYCQSCAQDDKFPKADLSYAYLHGANFNKAQCHGADFSCANFDGADFKESNCQRARFHDAQCQKANFSFSECQGANFKRSWCHCANFQSARLYGAQFDKAQCQEANFLFAGCCGVTFDSAQCQGADFNAAKCQGAYFVEANLQGANFKVTQCQGAVFDDTAFQGADFDHATNFYGACGSITRSLEDRIGRPTEMGKLIFEGELSMYDYLDITSSEKRCSRVWYDKMMGIYKANEGKEENNEIPKWFGSIMGVLEDPEGEIRKITEEIRKWRGDYLAILSPEDDDA